mgnify:CR=1
WKPFLLIESICHKIPDLISDGLIEYVREGKSVGELNLDWNQDFGPDSQGAINRRVSCTESSSAAGRLYNAIEISEFSLVGCLTTSQLKIY